MDAQPVVDGLQGVRDVEFGLAARKGDLMAEGRVRQVQLYWDVAVDFNGNHCRPVLWHWLIRLLHHSRIVRKDLDQFIPFFFFVDWQINRIERLSRQTNIVNSSRLAFQYICVMDCGFYANVQIWG